MKKAVVTMVAVVAAIGLVFSSGSPVHARMQYKKAWDAANMKEGSAISKSLNGMSNCNICHQGKERKNRNAYGAAIGKALGEKNVMDVEKINAALEKAGKEKPAGKDKTFGDLIKDGTWAPTPDEP